MLIREFLQQKKAWSKTAIICENKKMSYKEWHLKSYKLSKIIADSLEGKTIGMILPNGIAYAVAYFGCLYADKIIVPFYPESTTREIGFTIEHCKISAIITSKKYEYLINQLIENADVPLQIIYLDAYGEIIECILRDEFMCKNDIFESLEDVVILLHTSGTTSKSKRVMLTNRGLVSNVKAHCQATELNENDVCLIQLPMMFGYCNTTQFLSHTYMGACMVINPSTFFAADFFRLIERWKITNFTSVPTILNILLETDVKEFDISSLKKICFGGSPISKERLEKIVKKYSGIAFLQTYGLTEAGPRITSVSVSNYKENLGSVGKAIPGVEIKIIGEQGQTLSIGEIGEICVKSEGVMKGYFDDQEATQKVICNGWLCTGDLGYLKDDGNLYLVGRKKNLIISRGMNICPEEIESVILENENVVATKVFGVEDSILGEKIVAEVILSEESDKNINEIIKKCECRLSKYKVPHHFKIVDYIERTYNGKTKRGDSK